MGSAPAYMVVLEVPGRRAGVIRRNALVKANHQGNDYLVALAGESEWVRNVRAANRQVVIGRRQRRALRLVEVPPAERPPILRAYLLRSSRQPNSPAVQHEAQLYFGLSGDPSVEEISPVAEYYPVFGLWRTQARSFLPVRSIPARSRQNLAGRVKHRQVVPPRPREASDQHRLDLGTRRLEKDLAMMGSSANPERQRPQPQMQEAIAGVERERRCHITTILSV